MKTRHARLPLLDPYRAVRDANVTSLSGGSWHVPDDVYDHFLSEVFMHCETFEYHFCEVAGPVSRLFFDIDGFTPHLRERVEELVNQAFCGEWRATLGYRDNGANVHVVFTGLIVTADVRVALTHTLRERGVVHADPAANGLRLPGCHKPGVRDSYFPLTEDLSIKRRDMEDYAHYVAHPRSRALNSLRYLLPNMNGKARKALKARTVDPNPHIRYLRTLMLQWTKLEADKATDMGERGVYITVKGPGCTYCHVVGRPHKSNRVYFRFDGRDYNQHCFSCTGCSRWFPGDL